MLDADAAATLLDLAELVLDAALDGREVAVPQLDSLPASLHDPVGTFVTLTVGGELNGCIGTLDRSEPLGHAVPRLALAAAFRDPRLPALHASQRSRLTIEISLLSPLAPIPARSHDELVAQLRPGSDGVVVAAGRRQGLFLPTVWSQLPDPDDFLDHLWRKAGLRPRTWSVELQASRFTTERHERPPRR